MTGKGIDGGLALGAAVHYDFELADTPKPFEALVEDLFGAESPGGEFRHWFIRVENRQAPPPAPLDLRKLVRRVVGGGLAMAAAETAPKTADPDMMLVRAGTTPVSQRPERFSQSKSLYDAIAVFGAARLRGIGRQRALDDIVAFADAVDAQAGVVHWADSAAYAGGLASCGGSPTLSREQVGHITDLMYWQSRWGEVIRGPAWGTFLGAAHVERLGGIRRIEREAPCARVIALRSGGGFLEATDIENPLVEDHDDGGALARLAAFLAPVMGHRPPRSG
jgi:hypothetical protein